MIDIISGVVAIRVFVVSNHQWYWTGVAECNRWTGKRRRTAERAIQDAKRELKQLEVSK